MKRKISKEEKTLNKLRSLTLEYEKQRTANREFERLRVIEERDAYLSKTVSGEVPNPELAKSNQRSRNMIISFWNRKRNQSRQEIL